MSISFSILQRLIPLPSLSPSPLLFQSDTFLYCHFLSLLYIHQSCTSLPFSHLHHLHDLPLINYLYPSVIFFSSLSTHHIDKLHSPLGNVSIFFLQLFFFFTFSFTYFPHSFPSFLAIIHLHSSLLTLPLFLFLLASLNELLSYHNSFPSPSNVTPVFSPQ